jgi:arylsulfatase
MSLTPAFADVAPPPSGVVDPSRGRLGHREYLYFHHLTNRAIRVGDWKLVAKGADGPWELYDLKTDRCEQKNLAGQYPDRVREMAAQWQKCEDGFRRQAGPPPEKTGQSQKRTVNQKNRKES